MDYVKATIILLSFFAVPLAVIAVMLWWNVSPPKPHHLFPGMILLLCALWWIVTR